MPAPFSNMKESVYNIINLNVKLVEDFLTLDECKKIYQFIHLNYYNKYQQSHDVMSGNAFLTVDQITDVIGDIDKDLNLNLKNKMQLAIDHYSEEFNISKSVIDKSWILHQNKNSLLHHHTHLNAEGKGMLSGALWIHIPENSSKLEFVHPLEKHLDITNKKPKLLFEPKVGSFVIFPSYVLHGGDSWNQTTQRLVVSFSSHTGEE